MSPSNFGDVVMALRALRGIRAYLRTPLTAAQAREIVRHRLERRDDDFLRLASRAIFDLPASPYRTLLRIAGCEFGDLERLVRQQGVEGALAALYHAGVYLTVDEFKGRRPVRRGGTELAVDPDLLRNPLSVPHLLARTSGSRGVATRIHFDLACIRDRAVNMFLALVARGGAHWRSAIWGTPGLIPLLWYSASGIPAARWFSKIDPRTLGGASRFLWSARLLAIASRLARVPMPSPEHVTIDTPTPIIVWITETLAIGETPHLWGSPSSVVRLCEAAAKAGVNLAGARFTITGEPITDARLAVIRRVNGDALPDYGSADSGGTVSYGCLAPDAPDDMHLWSDLNAVVSADAPPLPEGALLVSSLRPTTPFVFLNVSMGDRGTIVERRCGCPMEELGWATHVHTVRSFEKLTAGGVAFDDSDVVRVLEEVLPRHFGGGPADYQLIEDDAGDGQPRLRLLVHPAIGPIDPDAVSGVFMKAIAGAKESTGHMAIEWERGGFLTVERAVPQATATGKILHLVAAPAAAAQRGSR